jgi:hypothetical protein
MLILIVLVIVAGVSVEILLALAEHKLQGPWRFGRREVLIMATWVVAALVVWWVG